jgi:6-phosphofructokinase 1
MNACLRAAIRSGINDGLEMYGIYRGYEGMIDGDIVPMTSRDVSNIIQRGGTILKSARSKEFHTPEGRKKAYDNLMTHGIEGLVVIGGDGSFRGASIFNKEYGIPVMGCPGTIDNDLYGTDLTIGYDTAINTVVDAVDKIRDTANSHDRMFIIEVMGRDAGFIALRSAIATGAEAVLIPETKTYINELIEKLERGWKRKKSSAIVIVAEGDDAGGAFEVAKKVKARFDKYDTRVTVLGHIQRGGSPSAMDRIIASRMGHAAVQGLIKGRNCEMAGVINHEVVFTSFDKATKHHSEISPYLLDLVEILSS